METISTRVCNPLLRTPLALIVDDSCPVINLNHFWIKQRHAWHARHRPGLPTREGDGDLNKLHRVPPTIPADFAVKWAEWCGEQGVKGKFSMVPYPAGVARIDQGFPDYPRQEYDAWMKATRELICPNFDITCEMLTHTHVVDLKNWQFTEAWEQFEWVNPPVEPLAEYVTTAMRIVTEAGLPCEGVTSPGAFGSQQEAAYARAALLAAQEVNKDNRPFYFLHVHDAPEAWPDVPLWHVDKANGVAIASIIGCTHDWFGGWTGYDAGDPNLMITEDLQGGCLPLVLARELPCVLVSHWPGFYFGGDEVGFDVLKTVKRRLDAYDPDGVKTRWMKTIDIGRYWMARQLSDITGTLHGDGTGTITIQTNFPSPDFTLAIPAALQQVRVNGQALQAVSATAAFTSGTFLPQGPESTIAFDLAEGTTTVELVLA
ncbi:MAG: hypothetical protein KF832_11685 [Caldilineaceae bacterium]|nr:hypothetical protein [Caldilineaceae bacterium]